MYLTDLVARAAARGGATAIDTPFDETSGINDRVDLAAVEAAARRRINEGWMREGVSFADPASTYVDAEVGPIGRDVWLGPGVALRGTTSIGDRTRVDVGCVLTDTQVAEDVHVKPYSVFTEATIGPRGRIGPFSHGRPGTVLEEDVHMGNFVETKKAHLMAGAKANHLSYLGDASVGARANIGAGTITCNYDGFNKHTTTIEAGAFIGSNTELVAPVTVGRGAFVGAGSTVTRDVPRSGLALTRVKQVVVEGWADRFRDAQARRKTGKSGGRMTCWGAAPCEPAPRSPVDPIAARAAVADGGRARRRRVRQEARAGRWRAGRRRVRRRRRGAARGRARRRGRRDRRVGDAAVAGAGGDDRSATRGACSSCRPRPRPPGPRFAMPARPPRPALVPPAEAAAGPVMIGDVAVVAPSAAGFVGVDTVRATVRWSRPAGPRVAPPVRARRSGRPDWRLPGRAEGREGRGRARLLRRRRSGPHHRRAVRRHPRPGARPRRVRRRRPARGPGPVRRAPPAPVAASPASADRTAADGVGGVLWRRGDHAVRFDLATGAATPIAADEITDHVDVAYGGAHWTYTLDHGELTGRNAGAPGARWRFPAGGSVLVGAFDATPPRIPVVRIAGSRAPAHGRAVRHRRRRPARASTPAAPPRRGPRPPARAGSCCSTSTASRATSARSPTRCPGSRSWPRRSARAARPSW